MKYKPLLFIILLLLAAIISCKKNDESNPSNNNVLTKCDIKYIKYSGGGYEWKYTFDNINPRKPVEAQYLNESGDIKDSYHIFYDPDDTSRVLAVQEWLYDFEFLHYVDSFTYDNDGNFALEVVYNYINDSLVADHYYSFNYNVQGQIYKTESYSVINPGEFLGSKEYDYNAAGDVTKISYYDPSHNLTAYEQYNRTGILYGHFDIFENILHRDSWLHAPDQIVDYYAGYSTTTTNYHLVKDDANYLVHDDIIITISNQNDTIPDFDYEYQCFH